MVYVVVGFWLLCGLIAGAMAVGRERDGAVWMIAGVFAGPLAILALLIFGSTED